MAYPKQVQAAVAVAVVGEGGLLWLQETQMFTGDTSS